MKKKHISCKKIAEYICSELGENIDSPECREIKNHLKTCPNCAAYLDSMKKTINLYQKYPDPKMTGKCRKELYTILKLNLKK